MLQSSRSESQKPVQLLSKYFADKPLSPEFTLRVKADPARFAEQAHFALYLSGQGDEGESLDPVFIGLFSAGRRSQSISGWVDGDYFEFAVFPGETKRSMSDLQLDIGLFRILGGLVPAGGSLMVSYSLFSKESKVHKETRLALDRGYPPVVTPLGFLLFHAGCGMGFKDWYFAEGGREGPEKLQGFKPINSEIAKRIAELTLQELRRFQNLPAGDDLGRSCKVRAEQVIAGLEGLRT